MLWNVFVFFHRIEERCPSIEEAVDVMEATGVEVVDGEGDVDVCLQGNLQGVRSDLPLGIGEVVCTSLFVSSSVALDKNPNIYKQ